MPLTKPLTDEPAFEGLSLAAQNFLYALRDKLDDRAYHYAEPHLLKSSLFPLRKRLRESDIAALVTECCQSGMVRLFTNYRGRPALHFPGCEQKRKREMSSEHVPPEEHGQMVLMSPANGTKVTRKEGRKEMESVPPVRKREMWQLLRDEKQLTDRIKSEAASCAPNKVLLSSLKTERTSVRAEMARVA